MTQPGATRTLTTTSGTSTLRQQPVSPLPLTICCQTTSPTPALTLLLLVQTRTNPDDFYTLSGTIGATYNAVYRGYPAVAFSGSNTNNSFYKDSLNEDPNDPQNIYGSKMVEFVDTLFEAQGENEVLLPIGTGLNVNFPLVSTDSKTGCQDPKFTFSRLTGEKVITLGLKYNETSGLFKSDVLPALGVQMAYNGDASLPSEDLVLDSYDCYSPVSVFSVDYTAPTTPQGQVKALLNKILVDL